MGTENYFFRDRMAASAFGSQCKVKSLFMSWVDGLAMSANPGMNFWQ
jgi:hypothetical protein